MVLKDEAVPKESSLGETRKTGPFFFVLFVRKKKRVNKNFFGFYII